jgi:hypothetical protein
MRKIPSLFVREFGVANATGVMATDLVTPGCEWVMRGEGRATVKVDGTACMVREGKLYKRFDRKRGKSAPEGWEACEDAPDPITGHWPGWVPVGDGPADQWHRVAFDYLRDTTEDLEDGTYELAGPKIQGNPHEMRAHRMILHGKIAAKPDPELSFSGIRNWLTAGVQEGIVWHHPDGRMAKIKRTDFGLEWPIKDDE